MTTFVFHLSFISLCFLLPGCGGSFKEMQNPIQKQEKVSLIEQFGFKTGYNFRQTQIDVDEEARKAGMSLNTTDEQARIL